MGNGESAPGAAITLKTGKPTAARGPPSALQPVAAGINQPDPLRDGDVRIRIYRALIDFI